MSLPLVAVLRRSAAGESEDLRAVKRLYFVVWAAMGLLFPYLGPYYRSLGLSGTQIGLVGMTAATFGAIGATTWGMLNDRFGRVRLLLAGACAGSMLAALALSQASSLLGLLPFAGLLAFCNVAILSQLDGTTIRLLGERAPEYGRYRLWGTLGFVATSAFSGLLVSRLGLHAIFASFAAVMLLFLAAALHMGNLGPSVNRLPLAGLRSMVSQPPWALFAVSIFLLWMAAMGGIGYVGIIIQDMGGPEMLIGLTATVAAALEIPLLFGSASLLARFGAARLTALAFAGYIVRMLLYAAMPSPAWAPAIALMQGVTYGPFLIGTVALAHQLAPPELKATSQGVLASTLSLASMAGALLCGWLLDQMGRQGLYLVLSGVCALALLVFMACKLPRVRQRPS